LKVRIANSQRHARAWKIFFFATTYIHAAIYELLEAVISVRPFPKLYIEEQQQMLQIIVVVA
jgi:hypothetical protein